MARPFIPSGGIDKCPVMCYLCQCNHITIPRTHSIMTPAYKSYPFADLDLSCDDIPGLHRVGRPLDDGFCLELLEKLSKKEKGLSNIATFADLKDVKRLKHVKSDISKEYLTLRTEQREFPGKRYRNDGTSSDPLSFDFDYLYPDGDEVPPPMSGVSPANLVVDDDVTMENLPEHNGFLYGTVQTHECDPSMKCPSCRGSKKCVTCCGRGEVRCSNCNGSGDCWKCGGHGRVKSYNGYETCWICGGNGKCRTCSGSGWFRCPDCNGTTVCPRCKGEGIVTCSRCEGTGFYQTIMSFRADRYANRLHYPPKESEMGGVIRTAEGVNPHGMVLKQWKNARTLRADMNDTIYDIGITDEDVDREMDLIRRQYAEREGALDKYDDEDIPYRETWSVATVPDVVVEYGVCDREYRLHILTTEEKIAFADFPTRLTLFDDGGEPVRTSRWGEGRKVALAKLAAYIFNADGMDIGETRMMTRIFRCLGYSNVERWRLMARLERFGPGMPFEELKAEIAPVLPSKKTLCFAWHCIAVDNDVTEKEQAVFDRLVGEYDLNADELDSLKAFTESKFAKLPDDQIVREYIDSKPRSVSFRKVAAMVVSGILLLVAGLCQFAFETEDLFTLVLLPVSFTALLLSIPFKRQRVYTATRPAMEPRPSYLYLLLLAGLVLFFWYVREYY